MNKSTYLLIVSSATPAPTLENLLTDDTKTLGMHDIRFFAKSDIFQLVLAVCRH